MTIEETVDDLVFEMMAKRKQYETGELPPPDQPKLSASPAVPEGTPPGNLDGDTLGRAAGTMAALLIQTTGDDET